MSVKSITKEKTFGATVEHSGPNYKGKKGKNGVQDSDKKGNPMAKETKEKQKFPKKKTEKKDMSVENVKDCGSKCKDKCAPKKVKDSVSKITQPGKKFTPKGKGNGVAAKGIPKTGPITNKA